METEKVYAMPFAKIYPILVAKAVGKGRTQAEVDEIIGWLTGYSACGVKQEGIEEPLMKEIRYWETNGVFFCLNQAAQSTEKTKANSR